MDPKVRDLYRRFLHVGKDYPLGLPYVREKVKTAFLKNRDLTDPLEIKKAIHKGRWMVQEMIGVIQLKKYRTLNARYTSEDLRDILRNLEHDRLEKEGSAAAEAAVAQENGKHGD
uniref:Complex 1 LYR protein domain-containing protein n=1 Tax=Globisporangium ultimum (strain ATCC 200006 / CBS 805.95 / DAOM BR144) TaxID=431595 RepID=K3X1X6_GLOUD